MKVQKGITLNIETITKINEFLKDKKMDFSNFTEQCLLKILNEEENK